MHEPPPLRPVAGSPSVASYASSSTAERERRALSERTLAIVKPEAFQDAEKIVRTVRQHGFTILAERAVRLSPEQAAELYSQHYGRHYFPHLVAHMSSGSVLALVLAATDAVHRWKELMGPARVAEAQAYWPDSVRARYGRRVQYGDYFNAVHGSDSTREAQREIHFFFPNMIVGPVIRRWQIADYMQNYINPTLLPALTELCKTKPAEPIVQLAEWLLRHRPDAPQVAPPSHAPDPRCRTPPPSEATPTH